MHSPNLIKAGVLALCITVLALASWEIHLRNKGWGTSYDNNMALYYLALFSKHQRAYEFWKDVMKYGKDQRELWN